jgi:hypothetical protein
MDIFEMASPNTIMVPGLSVYSGHGELTWSRTFHDLDFEIGRDDPFVDLYKKLIFAKRSSLMRVDEVNFTELVGQDLLGTSHMLRVDDDNPDNFTFNNFGDKTTVAGGGNYLGKGLASVPLPGFRRSVQETYHVVKESRRPLLSEIRTQQGDRFFEYRRLVLPLTNGRREVTDILVSVIPIVTPDA